MSARKLFRAKKPGVVIEVVELFDGFRVEWRYLDLEDESSTTRPARPADNEAAALRDAAWHLGLLPLEAGWKCVELLGSGVLA